MCSVFIHTSLKNSQFIQLFKTAGEQARSLVGDSSYVRGTRIYLLAVPPERARGCQSIVLNSRPLISSYVILPIVILCFITCGAWLRKTPTFFTVIRTQDPEGIHRCSDREREECMQLFFQIFLEDMMDGIGLKFELSHNS